VTEKVNIFPRLFALPASVADHKLLSAPAEGGWCARNVRANGFD